MFRLKEECSSINTILDQVKYRSEWIKYQEAQRRKEEEELEKERGRYVCVHLFVKSEGIITLVRIPCACVLVMQREMIFVCLLLLKGKVHFCYSCGVVTCDSRAVNLLLQNFTK